MFEADTTVKSFFRKFVEDHYMLNRSPVSRDTDQLIYAIKDLTGCRIHEFPAGSKCLTWTIPKRWEVREAWVRDTKGNIIVDFKDHPLHLWMHSIPFHKEVSKEELQGHILTDPNRPERIPFHFRNSFRIDAQDWGFCLRHNDLSSLTDQRYLVHIDTILDFDGTMKVADWTLPGKRPETVFFAAHSCHPGQVTDGLSNIAVMIELYRSLSRMRERKYTYRFIVGPEYFAAAGFLSAAHSGIENLKAGIYLDFLGNGNPIACQSSFNGNSILDRIMLNVLENEFKEPVKRGFRGLCGNDEIFYNGPGFHIPMPGLAAPVSPLYHTDADDPEHMDLDQLEEAVRILEKITGVLEHDFVPMLKFKGPLYLSGYGLQERFGEKNKVLQFAQIMVDGVRSCFDLAWRLDEDFYLFKDFFETAAEMGLAELQQVNHFQAP